jgi:hypothetical protein
MFDLIRRIVAVVQTPSASAPGETARDLRLVALMNEDRAFQERESRFR